MTRYDLAWAILRCLIIVLIFTSCGGNNEIVKNDRGREIILEGQKSFSFKSALSSIERVEGDVCQHSDVYLWCPKDKKDTICINVGVYKKHCPDIAGAIPNELNRVEVPIKHDGFLLKDVPYSWKDISILVENMDGKTIDSRYENRIYFYYPDDDSELNFERFVSKFARYRSKEHGQAVPVFYFMINTPPPLYEE
jgi:hypothetical protein